MVPSNIANGTADVHAGTMDGTIRLALTAVLPQFQVRVSGLGTR
jgi:hypothetical protein